MLFDAVPDHAHTTATRLMLAEILFDLRDPGRAEQVLQEADTHAANEAEVVAVALARTFHLLWSVVRAEEALAVNQAALARVTGPAARRMLSYNEGAIRIEIGQPEHGLALLEPLDPDIRSNPELPPTGWITAVTLKVLGLESTGRTDHALAFAQRIQAAFSEEDDHPYFLDSAALLFPQILPLAGSGQLDRARRLGERNFADLTAARQLAARAWTALYLGYIEWLAGHPVAARRWFAEAAALPHTGDTAAQLGPALHGLATSAALLGDLDAAEQALAEARRQTTLGKHAAIAHTARAWLAAARGDLAKARTILTTGATAARTAGLLTAEAWLLTDAARLGGAREVAGRLDELAQACDGAFAPARAHLAAALAADDPDQLTAAATELEAIGADLLAAEASTAAAAAWTRAGNTRKATAATQHAQALAARCEGARTPLLATAGTATALTARERDIALLAAHGTPSQDIADKLHLSVRTVENHLQHAYTKLGVTTRRELARTLGTRTTRQ
jgi:ATP/maltotriose-dependent transcriptional regulator MalT